MKEHKIFFSKNPTFEKCPSCGTAGQMMRSHSRNGFERLIKKMPFLKKYRCHECGWRGFRALYTINGKSLKTVFYYILIVLIMAALTKFLLPRLTEIN